MRLVAVLLALAACGPSVQVMETRMMPAPSRGKGCTLAFVQADLTSQDFTRTWDVLGYVTITDAESADPAAESNKKRVRDHACSMGGTSVGVAIAAANSAGSSVGYIVLRPKQAPAGVSTF
jgi:hypothetical protein